MWNSNNRMIINNVKILCVLEDLSHISVPVLAANLLFLKQQDVAKIILKKTDLRLNIRKYCSDKNMKITWTNIIQT